MVGVSGHLLQEVELAGRVVFEFRVGAPPQEHGRQNDHRDEHDRVGAVGELRPFVPDFVELRLLEPPPLPRHRIHSAAVLLPCRLRGRILHAGTGMRRLPGGGWLHVVMVSVACGDMVRHGRHREGVAGGCGMQGVCVASCHRCQMPTICRADPGAPVFCAADPLRACTWPIVPCNALHAHSTFQLCCHNCRAPCRRRVVPRMRYDFGSSMKPMVSK